MALNGKTPKKFSLSKRFASSDTPDDILWDDTDLTREIRSQEVGNCWTYPSINSFESSLIRLGLADRSVHGSEWSLTTLHAANFSRGFSIEPNPNKPSRYAIKDKGEFGGYATYAVQYFSTGTDGAIHLSTPEQTKQIASLFGEVSLGLNERKKEQKTYRTGWARNKPLSESPLFPAADQPRSFGYDQALVGTTQEETKEILLEHGLYGTMGFAVDNDAPLDFGSFRTKPSNTKVSDWLTPSSFHFRDANNRKLTQEKLVKKLSQQSSLYDINDTFIKQFFTGNEPGAQGGSGHAVAVLGWDDDYRNPKTDLTNKLIEVFQGRIEFINQADKDLGNTLEKSLEGFREFLSANQITYTNAKSRSRGAWIIQNSWGEGEGREYQYLPYDFANTKSADQLQELNNIGLAAGYIPATSTIFHQADASGLFGNVESSSTAIPLSWIWNMTGNSWHGLGFRFQPQQEAIVAIGSYLEPNVTETIMAEDGAIGQRYNIQADDSQWLQGALWRASDLLNPNPPSAAQPIARSRIEQAFTGYQTVEFDQPVDLDAIGEEPLIATLQLYADAAATQPISNARLLSYTPNPETIAQRQGQLNSPDFSSDPNSPNYYKHLPVPLLNPDPLQPLQQQRFYGLDTTGGLIDLGAEGEVVALNVVYADPDVLTSSVTNELTGSAASDQLLVADDANEVNAEAGDDLVVVEGNNNFINLGFGNDRLINAGSNNRIETGTGDDAVVLLAGSTASDVFLGDGRDSLMAIDARDNDLVISGGKDKDTYVFAETKHHHFEGHATINDFGRPDRIILRGFDAEDVKISKHPSSSGGLSIKSQDFRIDLLGTEINQNQLINLIEFN